MSEAVHSLFGIFLLSLIAGMIIAVIVGVVALINAVGIAIWEAHMRRRSTWDRDRRR